MQPDAYMDVAQVTLYVFWIFFACLIFYLRREDKREGYPLESTGLGGGVVHGFPRMPDPKTYLLARRPCRDAPNHKNDRPRRRGGAVALGRARRSGRPAIRCSTASGPAPRPIARICLNSRWTTFPASFRCVWPKAPISNPRDPDPRGMRVIGADSEVGGIVTDVWVDRAEALIRYLEVEVTTRRCAKRVLLPLPFAKIDRPPRGGEGATPSSAASSPMYRRRRARIR